MLGELLRGQDKKIIQRQSPHEVNVHLIFLLF
ncbi:MAG: hypothetical protein ACI976_002048, partial [Aureispira sp.]